jgi:hypothetical protein
MEVEDYINLPIQVRTYGTTDNCAGCRFWSEMIARSVGGNPIEAICLAPDSPNQSQYVTGRTACAAWKSGHFGATDEPIDGDEIRAAYAEEDHAFVIWAEAQASG